MMYCQTKTNILPEVMKLSFIAELDCFISAQRLLQDLFNTLKGE